ncbi:MAG: hypothetical protein QNJ46_05010 [Leptolyngbyaceae cyanobacterium MO_188.B28]|nr:hypothetical protein [Leptolyngbyaceae cyanobacterium MO_188.B28]
MMSLKAIPLMAGIGFIAALGLSQKPETLMQGNPFQDLRGQFLAVIFDGDFFASTYADNRIPGSDPLSATWI